MSRRFPELQQVIKPRNTFPSSHNFVGAKYIRECREWAFGGGWQLLREMAEGLIEEEVFVDNKKQKKQLPGAIRLRAIEVLLAYGFGRPADRMFIERQEVTPEDSRLQAEEMFKLIKKLEETTLAEYRRSDSSETNRLGSGQPPVQTPTETA